MFAKIKNGVCEGFPYTETDLKNDNPYTNYGNSIDVASIFPMTEAATVHGYTLVDVVFDPYPPIDTHTQRLVELPPKEAADGTWHVGWDVIPLTQTEQDALRTSASHAARAERNRRLAACDWTQLADATANKPNWATYRQALRDVTAQSGFPWTIDWPVQP
jgi:hypothetical protein